MEDIKLRYPYFIDNSPDKFPLKLCGPFEYFLPLRIVNCNGAFAKSFSEAEVYVRGFLDDDSKTADSATTTTVFNRLCIGETQLQLGMIYELLCKPSKQAQERRKKALQALDNFFTSEDHFHCLKKLSEDDNLCEKTVQEVLASHLFQPLTMEKSRIRVDASRYKGNADAKCKYCSAKVPTANTSFGNQEIWHGSADILLDRTVIKVEKKSEEDASEATFNYSAEPLMSYIPKVHKSSFEDTDEPAMKTLKVENASAADGDAGDSEDIAAHTTTVKEVKTTKCGYMPYGPNKIPSSGTYIRRDNKTLSEVLAQTIVNAFLQARIQPNLKNHFIPSFLASETHVTIHMYRPSDDTLLTQAIAMPIMFDGKLNSYTILCVWLTLNMLSFPTVFPHQDNQSEFYPHCNFANLVGKEAMEIYKTKLQRPLQSSPDKNLHFIHDPCRTHLYTWKQLEKIKDMARPHRF